MRYMIQCPCNPLLSSADFPLPPPNFGCLLLFLSSLSLSPSPQPPQLFRRSITAPPQTSNGRRPCKPTDRPQRSSHSLTQSDYPSFIQQKMPPHPNLAMAKPFIHSFIRRLNPLSSLLVSPVLPSFQSSEGVNHWSRLFFTEILWEQADLTHCEQM